jgi:Putative restriction endonuclease
VYPEPGTERQAVRLAPDVDVAFGVPKGYRGSYRVWEEEDIFPQVIFKVWSPSNRAGQMEEKRQSYELYGAEEYYVIYPEAPVSVEVWHRQDDELHRVEDVTGWVSPRLGIRFEQQGANLRVIQPDGTPFLTFAELIAQRDAERDRAAEAELRAENARREALQIAAQRDAARATAAADHARAALEAQQRAEAEQRAERLAEKLRELGLDPDAE